MPKKSDSQSNPNSSSQSFSYNLTGEYRDSWRIFRIMSEFVEGYQFLASFDREVTILGSARLKSPSKYIKEARKLGKLLGTGNYTTITGGGPGIMEAANQGAFEVGGESLGINIQLPFEQRINPYVKKSAAFYFFITRKVMLTAPSQVFICFPGGFGTLDEFFEIIDMMELGFMIKTPIILVGKEYWNPLFSFLRKCSMKKTGAITEKDLEMCHIVDNAEEAYEIIKTTKDQKEQCLLSPGQFQCDPNINWRVFRIMAELVEGFDFLTGLVEDVTILGTGHIKRDSKYYKKARQLAGKVAKKGFSVVTGGGFGIMEAASRGAHEVGGDTIGINTKINYKERVNKYVKRSIAFSFPFTRKFILLAPSKAYVFFPGGFGTMHELFEAVTLMQTGKMEKVPVILIGKDFWCPMIDFIKGTLARHFRTIAKEDVELFHVTDSVDEAVKIIVEHREGHK